MNLFSHFVSLNIAYFVGFSICIAIIKVAQFEQRSAICFNKDDIIPLLNENNITII